MILIDCPSKKADFYQESLIKVPQTFEIPEIKDRLDFTKCALILTREDGLVRID